MSASPCSVLAEVRTMCSTGFTLPFSKDCTVHISVYWYTKACSSTQEDIMRQYRFSYTTEMCSSTRHPCMATHLVCSPACQVCFNYQTRHKRVCQHSKCVVVHIFGFEWNIYSATLAGLHRRLVIDGHAYYYI